MYKLKSVGVLSVAKIMGAMYTLLGLIFMPFILIFSMIGTLAGGSKNAFGAIGGIAVGILLPFVYGLMGFVVGAMSSLLYNLIAKWLGGIEIEMQAPVASPPASIG